MPSATDSRRMFRPWLLAPVIGALVLVACFGGSEAGEVDMIAGQDEEEEEGGPDESGPDNLETNGDKGGEGPGSDEQALLEIISQAEGGEANPDNRTGAPSSFPSVACLPQNASEFTVSQVHLPKPWGRDLSYLVCIQDMDLMRITVTDPAGDLHQQLWSDVLFGINFSVLDEPGTYEIIGRRRQGDDVVTVFEHPPLEHLHIVPERDEPGIVRVEIAGYGDERSLTIAVYTRSEQPVSVPNSLSYLGSLDEVELDEDGTTVVRVAAEDEDSLCFFVDAAHEDRFPSYQYGCLKPESVAYEPGDLDLAVELTEALDESDRQAISPVVAAVDEARAIAIATVVDTTTGQPDGAALFEGALVGGDRILGSAQLRERDTDADFKDAFANLCTVAAETYVVIGNPCLRLVLLPDVIIVDGFEPIQIDDESLIEITDRAVVTDCLPYDPEAVSIIDEGPNGFVLTDGTSRMAVVDTKTDAEVALAVARYHDRHCFVGRGNARADRDAYVTDFWLGGKPGGPVLADQDCVRYDPTRLEIINVGDAGWGLNAGGFRLLLLDTEEDARQALNTAAGFTHQCFAGRDNVRANRSTYLFQYWR